MSINAAQLMAMENLVNKLNNATKAYDEGHPVMSDEEWDNLYFELLEWENGYNYHLDNSPTQKISYEVVNQLNKVKHNHLMLSLDKTKEKSDFISYFTNIDPTKDVIGMLKLDGLTCSLRYINGKLVSAETRGNGEEGEDVLHNAKVVKNIPKYIDYKDELIVDGEVICTYSNFESFANDYKNPRNFASGSIRLLDSAECEKRNLSFVVWNIIKGYSEINSFYQKLEKMENLGFTIVPYTTNIDLDWSEYLQNQAKELGYPIDGLVGRFDDISFGNSLGATGHHSRAAYAFKFYDEEYETHLLDIEWTMGRTGVLTPVAVFEPVDDGESVIQRASLHNISIMSETMHGGAYVGEPIAVAKMNQIIPQVVRAEKYGPMHGERLIQIPNICPICGKPVEIIESDSGTKNLVCSNPNCEGKFINQLDHYCGKKGFDIKGLSLATLDKLLDWGWITTYKDIYNLSQYRAEWVNKTGFGEKSVDKLLASIEESKNCTFEAVIAAMGIPLIGRTIAKDLAKRFKTYEDFRYAIETGFDFSTFDGYGYEMNKSISEFDYSWIDDIVDNYLHINYPQLATNENTLQDKVVVITGKLSQYKNRDAMKEAIEAHGGKVAGSVTSKTSYLINNDVTSTSAKNQSAKKLGVPIISETEFIEKYLIS